MIPINGSRISVSLIDRHTYICDLVEFERPLLTLYRDQKQNVFYLWCDSNDSTTVDRFAIFPVSREQLLGYLQGQLALLAILSDSPSIWFLDVFHPSTQDNTTRRLLRAIEVQQFPEDYLPAPDSYFDASIAPDVSLQRELAPTLFKVPIDGAWFFSDLPRFSSVYSQLYAFMYCTTPQFVTNLGDRLAPYLRSPWKGGFSRVNFFGAIERLVPSIHDLKIRQIEYQSPGSITIEALESVGDLVSAAVTRYLANEDTMHDLEKRLQQFMTSSGLAGTDASRYVDSQLRLTADNQRFLNSAQERAGGALNLVEEIAKVASQSPNIVVTAKLVLALLKRIRKLAEFQRAGLIDLT